jgi:hypothetical protein
MKRLRIYVDGISNTLSALTKYASLTPSTSNKAIRLYQFIHRERLSAMPKKTNFNCIEFFRKIRDEQAIALSGKSAAEIIAYFKSTNSEFDRSHAPCGNAALATQRRER